MKEFTAERRAKISAALRGRPVPLERRAKIAAALRGRVQTPEHRAKNSAANKGRTLSPEHCRRISEAMTGVKRGPLSPETRAKLSAAKLGVKRGPMSAENRAKLSAAHRGVPLSDRHRAAIAAGQAEGANVLRAPIKGECVYCGSPAREFDHVIPVSRGGPDEPSNKVPCCRSCNSSKRRRTPDEWFAGVAVR